MADKKVEFIEFTEDYEIATGKTPKELVTAVRKLLEKEYEPEGPVFITQDGTLCQVMILMDEEEVKEEA